MGEARHKMEALFDLVARTLGTSRRIFMDELPKQHSMMSDVLEYIQSDSPDLTDRLPPELRLTTQTLLTSLPSSTHFMLLPPNIRSYKPYVDVKVANASPQLNTKLEEWFHKSVNDIHQSLERCFAELGNIRDVWRVRCQLRRWVESADGLQSSERVSLHSILDAACGYQIATIWKSTFSRIQASFQQELASALSGLEEESENFFLGTQRMMWQFLINYKSPRRSPCPILVSSATSMALDTRAELHDREYGFPEVLKQPSKAVYWPYTFAERRPRCVGEP